MATFATKKNENGTKAVEESVNLFDFKAQAAAWGVISFGPRAGRGGLLYVLLPPSRGANLLAASL